MTGRLIGLSTRPRAGGLVRVSRFAARGIALSLVGLLLLLGVGPRLFSFQVLYVRSGSMAPGMPTGSLAIVRQASASSLDTGDVIAFERPAHPGELITHRIVGLEQSPQGAQWVTKGDANSFADPWRIPAAGTGWRRVGSITNAGYALGYARAFAATPWLLTGALWLGVLTFLRQLWHGSRRARLALG